jgi:3-dehydroquinate synthase
MSQRPQRIILIGFSGTGKSLAAPLVAERLGWRIIDTDSLIEEQERRPIPEIFRRLGEPYFRRLEADAIRSACQQTKAIISTGGGAMVRPDSRRLMADGGFIVCLEARPETILRRIQAGSDDEPADRPLLAGPDPLARIRALKEARQPAFALADHTIHTDARTPEQVAAEVVRAWRTLSTATAVDPERLTALVEAPVTAASAEPVGASCMVRTPGGSYPVFVQWNGLFDLGRRLREAGLTRRAYLLSDETVHRRYGAQAEASIRQADIPVDSYTVPPGESAKTLDTASSMYDWLVDHRAERGDVIVALGGGLVTDMAGFVAATFTRGLPLVQVPTSLLAMVDAAVGGKVAVNHPKAKNMIGAFYQPRLVLADVATLRTLPQREVAAGWAEVIKHALIADPHLLSFMEERAQQIIALEPESSTDAIRRSVAIKAEIVSQDEREESGRRMTLNYGHSVGHALEAATEYGRFLHGEAVAIGMTAAASISRRLGLVPPDVVERQRRILDRFGLPTHAEGIDRKRIRSAMTLDKKVRDGTIRWVLLEDVGRTTIRNDVPNEIVEQAIDEAVSA